MKKLILIMMAFQFFAWPTFAEDPVYHTLKGDETMWFLAKLYYDDGSKFEEILKANQLTSLKAVKIGQKYIIPSPIHLPNEAQFQERELQLRKDRELKLLAKRSTTEKVKTPAVEDVKTAQSQTEKAPEKPEDAQNLFNKVENLLKKFKKSPSALADEELKHAN